MPKVVFSDLYSPFHLSLFSHPAVKPSNIVIDAVSMSLLNGSVIDFATELIGSSFRVLDNPQAKGSGCGCGVSWELKV
jgi:Fe-S cluster assembly iron-binding protein IscA